MVEEGRSLEVRGPRPSSPQQSMMRVQYRVRAAVPFRDPLVRKPQNRFAEDLRRAMVREASTSQWPIASSRSYRTRAITASVCDLRVSDSRTGGPAPARDSTIGDACKSRKTLQAIGKSDDRSSTLPRRTSHACGAFAPGLVLARWLFPYGTRPKRARVSPALICVAIPRRTAGYYLGRRWEIQGVFDKPESPWEIVTFARSTEEDQYLYLVDRVDAERFLRQFKGDTSVMAHLRRVLAPTDPVYRWSDDQVIRVVASRLSTRRLLFRTGPRNERPDIPQGSGGGGQSQQAGGSAPPPQQSAPAKEKEKTWIGVRVVDQRGKPVKDVRVQIKLTDGQVVIIDMASEELEPDGSYRTEKVLDPGLCEISFPDLDGSEWKPQ